VAFWDDQLTERGTSVALFDYAAGNRDILGHRSLVLLDVSEPARARHHPAVLAKFRSTFADDVVEVDGFAGVDAVLARLGAHVLYMIKSGAQDGRVSRAPGVRTVVHCVFSARAADRHGDVYAAISRHVDTDLGAAELPVVPHMVHLPQPTLPRAEWRRAHGIPEDAVVFGRYGGRTTFDIPWVRSAVADVARRCPDIYFVLVNTDPWGVGAETRKNILFLPAVVDPGAKAAFILACDAMLWGRSDGETFGLAVAEFSSMNRPVFVTRIAPGQCAYVRDPNAHAEILGDRGVWYTEDTLRGLLESFRPAEAMPDGRTWNAYADYTPEKVMATFARVFL